MIDVEEEKENSKGTLRLRVVAYTPPGCSREARTGWVSKKLFEFRGAAPGAIAPSVQTSKVRRVSPPPPPIHTGTKGTRKTVTGKHGALLRKGCELSSVETGISLDQGDLCYIAGEDVNEQNIVRAHVVLRSAKGGPWESVDGWCTAKFLSGADGEEPLPAVGSKPVGRGAETELATSSRRWRRRATTASRRRGHRRVYASREWCRSTQVVAIKFPPCTDTGRVLLFPGQGAQKVGMLAPYEDVSGVKEMFADASEVFGRDLLELIQKGPEQDLNDTRFSQVCVFLTSMASVAKLHQDDPTALQKVTHTAGFSLGEYSALTFAGVMDIATAVRLLKVRSDAMGAACDLAPSGMMTVVGYEDADLQALLPDGVSVANQLFPKGRVVAGPRDALKALEAAVKKEKRPGTKTIMQPVSGAFHSPFMASAADALREALDGVSLKAPSRTVYSNVTARPHASDPLQIKDALCKQLTAGVLWEDTIKDMIKADIDALYEPAPGKQLTSMMRRISAAHHPKMKNV